MWPLIAAAALNLISARAKHKQEQEQQELDGFNQASQQWNSGYTHAKPVTTNLQAVTPMSGELAGAAANTWAQAQAFQDFNQRQELSKLYGENMAAQSAYYKKRADLDPTQPAPGAGAQAKGAVDATPQAAPLATSPAPATGAKQTIYKGKYQQRYPYGYPQPDPNKGTEHYDEFDYLRKTPRSQMGLSAAKPGSSNWGFPGQDGSTTDADNEAFIDSVTRRGAWGF